jgi:KDO2-lipid IV(A) lauroyltransferase
MRLIASHVSPRGPAYAVSLGRAIGRVAWAIPGKRKALSLRNAAIALPHLTPRERQRIVREAVMNSLPYWPETVAYACRGPENVLRTISVEGREHLDAALAQGKGVISPGIHLGIFPLMATWMTQAGYDFQFLSRFPHNKRASDLMARVRARTGIRLIRDLPRRQCLIDCRSALARGGIIGLQLDQRAMTSYPSVNVPFFGHEFHAFGGMVSLALKSGAPIVPMYIFRTGGIRHRLVIEPEIAVDRSLPRKEAVRSAIELLMRRFEEWVVEHPEHWWWPHRFWFDV